MSTPVSFWTEDITQLFSLKNGAFPHHTQTLSVNMNAIVRMALIACLIIAFFRPVIAVSTFSIIMILTMAIYYSVSSKDGYIDIDVYKEQPRPESVTGAITGASPGSYSSGLAGDLFSATPNFRPLTASEFCTNKRHIPDDPSEYVSENQMLLGGANPKTYLPLMNATKIRSHDINAWKNTDLTVHSAINASNPTFDTFTSGYVGPSFNFAPKLCKECSRTPCTCMYTVAARNLLGKRTTSLMPESESYDDDLPEVTVIDKAIPSMTDVVDPRFSGYGPTDRCYFDPITGQRKFFYSDIDATRMPSYISRNNIDIYPWAPKYGSGFDGRTGVPEHVSSTTREAGQHKGLNAIKQKAFDAFRHSTAAARTDLQESLMSKRNGEMWQLRAAPIY